MIQLLMSYLGKIKLNQQQDYYTYSFEFAQIKSQEKTRHYVLIVDTSCLTIEQLQDMKLKLNDFVTVLVRTDAHQYLSIVVMGTQKVTYLARHVCYQEEDVSFQLLKNEILSLSGTLEAHTLSESLEAVKNDLLQTNKEKNSVILLSQGYLNPYFGIKQRVSEQDKTLIRGLKSVGTQLSIIAINLEANFHCLYELAQLAGVDEVPIFLNLKNQKQYIRRHIKKLKASQELLIHLENNECFLVRNSVFERGNVIVSVTQEPQLVLTSQKLNVGTSIKYLSLNTRLTQSHEQQIFYSLIRYYWMSRQKQEALFYARTIKNERLCQMIENAYTEHEVNVVLAYISECQRGNLKSSRMMLAKYTSSLTNLEVLYRIYKDEQSSFLWDARQPYKRQHCASHMIEDNYQFVKPTVGFYEAKLKLSESALNVRLKVKLEGSVIHQETQLKKDAYIYRDYVIMSNGQVMIEELYCELSDSLKKELKKQKMLKNVFMWGKKEICVVKLKSNCISSAFLQHDNPNGVVDKLFKLARLKCERWAISQQQKKWNHEVNVQVNDLSYRINKDGLYHPCQTQMMMEQGVLVGVEQRCEWSLHSFSLKQYREEALKRIAVEPNEDIIDYQKRLVTRQIVLNELIEEETMNIQFMRLASQLLGVHYFDWENQETKVKKQRDPIFKLVWIIDEQKEESVSTNYKHPIREVKYEVFKRL